MKGRIVQVPRLGGRGDKLYCLVATKSRQPQRLSPKSVKNAGPGCFSRLARGLQSVSINS